MNYWERHIGDYARDAGHLSLLEHGAYTVLLDRYYSTEAPIPADQAHRICRAKSKDERAAVDAVLAEFFTLTDGRWVNGRADREIEKAQARIEAARTNGTRGGRPKKNQDETQQKPTGLSVGSDPLTQQKALHTPDTTISSSPTVQKRARASAAPPIPPDVDAQVWSDWLALRKAKHAPVTATVLDSARAESIAAGMSLEAFLRVWCARGSQGLQADWLKPHERGHVNGSKADDLIARNIANAQRAVARMEAADEQH